MASSVSRSGSVSQQHSMSEQRVRLQTPSSIRSTNKRRRLQTRSSASSRSIAPAGSLPDALIDMQDNIVAAVEDEAEEADETDVADEIIMAIDMRNRDTIGCSYFTMVEETLYVLNDIKYGGIEIVEKRTSINFSRFATDGF